MFMAAHSFTTAITTSPLSRGSGATRDGFKTRGWMLVITQIFAFFLMTQNEPYFLSFWAFAFSLTTK